MKTISCKRLAVLLPVLFGLLCSAACQSTTKSDSNANTTVTAVNNSNNKNSASPGNAQSPTSQPTPMGGTSTEPFTPPDGSPERKAILDAVASYLKTEKNFPAAVMNEVDYLKVFRGYAYIEVNVDGPDESPYGLVQALLVKEEGRWRAGDMVGDGESVKDLRARSPIVPEDIFPPNSK